MTLLAMMRMDERSVVAYLCLIRLLRDAKVMSPPPLCVLSVTVLSICCCCTIVYTLARRTLLALEGDLLMASNEFRRSVSVDFAPQGRTCEWCGKPAERQLTAIGGISHNQHGIFCRSCGDQFLRVVTHTPVTTLSSATPLI
jgi:hypothetical protein